MKIRLAVLFGGRSVEHEISVISALQAMENLRDEKYEIIPVYIDKCGDMYCGELLRDADEFKNIPALLKKCTAVTMEKRGEKVVLIRRDRKRFGSNDISEVDIALPVVHGTNVEDGALQGYLRTLGLPFVGCDVTASALGMDKYASKAVLADGGFPVLEALRLRRGDSEAEKKIESKFAYPVIIKPVNLGSSVGISVASDRKQLAAALDTAFGYASAVICEPAVTNLREINCSVIGDENEAEASECEEPLSAGELLSYNDKYMSGGKKCAGEKGMASLKRRLPADITPELRNSIRETAAAAFRHLGCCGVARIDFLLDCDTDRFYINEFNTIPGSLAFYLWQPLGVSYGELLDRIIQLALKRRRSEAQIMYSFDTNILTLSAAGGTKGMKK